MWRTRPDGDGLFGVAEHDPGDVAGESWWVLYGVADTGVDVMVVLEDGGPTAYSPSGVYLDL